MSQEGTWADIAARRGAILDAAARLLATEGPGSLSMRRVAAEVGTSTQAIYTLFGGKPGLADALFAEGFRRLAAAENAVPQDGNPLERLRQLGCAYRGSALQNPHFYGLMFGRAIPEFVASERSQEVAWGTFGIIIDAVRDCQRAGLLLPDDPKQIATELWSAVHGTVALELAQMIPPEAAAPAHDRLVRALLSSYSLPEGHSDPQAQTER